MNSEALNYYQSISSIMESFCKPLNDYLGVSFFLHFKVYHKDSTYVFLTNNLKIAQEYCSKVNSDIMYFQNYIENSGNELVLWPTKPTNIGMKIFYDNGYWPGLAITHRREESTEQYVFLSNKNNNRAKDLFIKYHSLLEKFSLYFQAEQSDIIKNANKYKAKYSNGFNCYLPEHDPITSMHKIRLFLESIGINKGVFNNEGEYINLTNKEKYCLELINKGFSIKEISRKLLLAPKTIETHLNNIKHKIGCYNKKELIHIYRNSFMEDTYE